MIGFQKMGKVKNGNILTIGAKTIMIEIHISGQSDRKIMAQSYRTCKMIASCNRSIMTALRAVFLLFKENTMLVGFLTVKETAEKWGINPRTVQAMCSDGRIQGAKKFGKAWQFQKTKISLLIKELLQDSIKTGEIKG